MHKRVQLCAQTGLKLCAQKAQSSVHKRLKALCTRRRIPGSVHTRVQALCTKGSKLCAHKGSSSVHTRVQALCTKGSKLCAQARVQLCAQKAQSSVHKRVQALCTGKGPSSVHTRAQALCTGRGSALCTHRRIPGSVHTQEDSGLCAHTGRFRALCTKGFKLCAHKGSSSVHKRLKALCTGKGSALCTKGSKLCAQTRVQLCAQAGAPSSVYKRVQALCTGKGSALCTGKGSALCTGKGSALCTGKGSALCTKGFYLQKHTAFKLSDRTSLSSTVFYNPLPRHIHGKSNSFSASLGAKSILEKGLSTYFAESPLDFSVFLDFKSAKSTSVHREHLQKRLYPVFLPEPELPHLLQQSPSCYFCTGAGYSFALKSA